MSLSRKIIKGLSWDFIGITVVNIIGILSSIVFVKLLNAEIYGIFIILMNFYQMLVLFTTFGLDTTLLKFYSEWKTKKQFFTINKIIEFTFKFRAGITLILGILLLLFSDFTGEFIIKKSVDPALIQLIGIFFIVSSFQGVFQQVLIAEYQQSYINIMLSILFSLRFIFGYIQLKFFQGGVYELILIYIIAELGLVIVYGINAFKIYRENKNRVNFKEQDEPLNVKYLFSFSFFAYIYIVLGYVLGKGMDIFLIGKLISDTKEATYYSLAHGISYMVISFSSRAFSGGIPLTVTTELYTKKDYNKLRTFFTGFFEALYFFIIPMAAGAWILRDGIVQILYGPGFEIVSLIMSIFLITMIFLKFSSITSTYIIAMGWEKKLVTSRLILGVTNFVLDILFIPKWGALGAVVASTIAGILSVTFETVLLVILLKPKFPFKFILKVVTAAGIMSGIVWFLNSVFSGISPLKTVLLLSLIGGIIYFFCSFMLKPLSKEYLEIIKTKNIRFTSILNMFSEK